MSGETVGLQFDRLFRDGFETLLAWRRDVRRFRADPLPEGTVERLIGLAAHAPSVGNAQPARFVRIRSADLRHALARHVDRESERAAGAYAPVRSAAYRGLKLHGLREAPEVLAVFCDEAPEAGHGLGRQTMPEMLRYSAVMAVHTLWLAARVDGIGLGWVSIMEPAEVRSLLDLPSIWTLVALLCLGTPEAP